MAREIELRGGAANAGAVTRVGDVVLRPTNPYSPTVSALLLHFHRVGFHAVPQPLGIAHDGRERLEFIPGDVPLPPFPAGSRSTFWTMQEDEHGEQRFGTAAQAAEWDARYSEREDAMWSGRPNGRLVAEIAKLSAGDALDVGCGEGADAIWLAQHGWTVTAIDISDVAVLRAREAAEVAGATVEWVCGDALQTPFPAHSFDLVSLQYPALPKAAGETAVQQLLDAVRPGGLLLAVYHDLDAEHGEHMKAQGFDPADYVGAEDLARLLGDCFTVEVHAVEPRIDPPPGTQHTADIVLRARRR